MVDLMVGNFLTLVAEFIAIRAGWDFWSATISRCLGRAAGSVGCAYDAPVLDLERTILGAAMFNLCLCRWR